MGHVNDAINWESRLAKRTLIGSGALYEIESPIFGLAAGEEKFLQLQNNAERPVFIESLIIIILESRGDHEISLFSGGTLSGGAAIPQIPQKNFDFLDAPYAIANFDVTVDVVGSSLGLFEGTFSRIGGYLFTSPGSQQYMSVKNTDSQASAGIQVVLFAARIQ